MLLKVLIQKLYILIKNKISMQKRGVSPVIASVLFIGFTIVTFLTISHFVNKDIIDPTLDEYKGRLANAFECQDGNLAINNVEYNSELKLTLENKGNIDLKGVWVRAIGVNGVDANQILQNIRGLDIKKVGFSVEKDKTGNLDKVEVFPLVESGLCNLNSIKKDFNYEFSGSQQEENQTQNPVENQTENPIENQTETPIENQTETPVENQTENYDPLSDC